MKKIVFGIIVLLACLTGCSKSDDNSYTFNSTGGVKEYAAEMNSTSLLITIGSTTSGEAIHMIGHTDDTSSDGIDQWVASLDWIDAYYMPVTKRLLVRVKQNNTGDKRSATVSYNLVSGGEKKIKISQSR